MCLYAILWYEMIPRPGSCHCSLTEEVTYQVTLYLCSSLSIQKRLSPIQTTNLNLVDQERPEASHLQYNPCLQCSLQFCWTSVFPSHKEELFSHVPLFFWWMYSDIWSSCQEIYRDVFSLWCLFSIDGFFSFCTHLCTHISNINMHT